METPKTLTLVVPVFNAPDHVRCLLGRLGELDRVAAACGFALVEALLVDDGSQPPLATQVADWPARVRVIRLPRNRGKGHAVKRGVFAARGDWVLMSDADLSAPFAEFAKLAPHADAWLVCGSRHGRSGMPWVRRVLSRLFHVCAYWAGVRDVQDTQCGFKLFRTDAMRPVFAALKTARFAFDVELILRTHAAGGTIREVPVAWHGGRRSSLRVCRDAPRMLWDLLRLRV